jgi:hypothetical protein
MIQTRGAQGEILIQTHGAQGAIQIQIPRAQEEIYDSVSRGAGGKFRFRLAGLSGNSDSDSRDPGGKL